MTNLSNVFFGVPQSRYAALAILIAIVVVALAILFGDSPVPMSQKFGFVLMIFLISLPGLALSLFQLTCIVTGSGFDNKRWWCSLYAWVLSAIMIFYAVLLVIAALMSLKSKTTESFVGGGKTINMDNYEGFNADKSVIPKYIEKEEENDSESAKLPAAHKGVNTFVAKPPASEKELSVPTTHASAPAPTHVSTHAPTHVSAPASASAPAKFVSGPTPAGDVVEPFTSSYSAW